MGNKTQVKREGNASDNRHRGGHQYINSNTTKNSTFKRNISYLKGAVFTNVCLSDASKYEDFI